MRGVLLFAFNTDKVDYYKMAINTAKRANKFLDLPVTVITDESTDLTKYDYKFDNVIIRPANKDNLKGKDIWINKGRYQAYELSPYDETLLIDTDYLINSDKLLTIFDLYDDFMCHNTTSIIMVPDDPQEKLGLNMPNSLWATVIAFKKTPKVKMIFDCMQMVQENYNHYVNLYNFFSATYRNDYSLTIALKIVNGQSEDASYYIPWNLVHVAKNTYVYRDTDTEYTVLYDHWNRGKIKKEYITIKDMDIHLLNKDNYMELIDE